MKNGKRILSVQIKRMLDDSPDTSWLGKYGNRPESKYAIDRAHSEDCASLDEASDIGREWLQRIENQLEHRDSGDYYEEDTEQALNVIQDLLDTPECDCSRAGRFDSREYRYFNPCWQNYKGEPDTDIRKSCRQDFDRMESLNAGNWYFIGIRAEAEIHVPYMTEGKGGRTYFQTQHITSGGLWGVESDADTPYLESIEAKELSALRAQLKAIGFSARAISTAFKTIEHREE